jgi:hypothetical protein
MSRKNFIELADAIRRHNELQQGTTNPIVFGAFHLNTLATFCQSQNPAFKRERWLGYIKGVNGKNGGSIKH